MRFGNDSSWPTNLDWVIMIQQRSVLLFSYILFLFEISTSIIIGLTSQLVDADATENTNAQTQTRNAFHIIIKHQSLLHFEKNTIIRNIIYFFVLLKMCCKISLPLTQIKTIVWYQKERHTNQSPVGRTPSGGMALFSDGSEELVTSY